MKSEELAISLNALNKQTPFKTILPARGGYVIFSNTSGKEFTLGLDSIIAILNDIYANLGEFKPNVNYDETKWRTLAASYYKDGPGQAIATVQTKPLFSTLGKLIIWANSPKLDHFSFDNKMPIEDSYIKQTINELELVAQEFAPTPVKAPILMTDLENILMYGPPGTGKTYLLQTNYLEGRSDDEKEFVTFHQSYSYEEFVEGIKPAIGSNNKLLITYHSLRDFAFNSFKYLKSTYGDEHVLSKFEFKDASINEESFKGGINPAFFEKGLVLAHFSESKTKEQLTSSLTLRYFNEDLGVESLPHLYFTTQWTDTEDGPLSFKNLAKFIHSISNGELEAKKEAQNYILVQKLNSATALFYEYSDGVFYAACKKAALLAGYASLDDCCVDIPSERNKRFKKAIEEGKIFCFCIDEINRANVSSVFGELITLIEPDKRLGAENELIVKLTYSKRHFGVPANLKIIGSMNTADRSITLIDSALRRRFNFEEVAPRPELLKDIELANIELETLLSIINKRIRFFLGKDLCIGHAYFLSGMSRTIPASKIDLLRIMINNVLPLLEEYFYNDYKKISLILGDGNKTKEQLPFYVKDPSSDASNLFKGNSDDIDEVDVFHLNPDILDLLNNSDQEIPDELFNRIYS